MIYLATKPVAEFDSPLNVAKYVTHRKLHPGDYKVFREIDITEELRMVESYLQRQSDETRKGPPGQVTAGEGTR